MTRLRLVLDIKYDRVFPSRFQNDYLILSELTKQFQRLIPAHFNPSDEAVLIDYGCGDMPYKFMWEPYVGKYQGVDVPSHHDTGFDTPVDFYTDENGLVPTVKDGEADIVFTNMVLEHVNDPILYLNECYRMLKPGGTLFLATLGYWQYHPVPVDYWRWMGPGLRKNIEDVGFEVKVMDGLLGLAPIGVQMFLDGTVQKLPRPLRPYWIYVMQGIAKFFNRFYGPYKDNRDAAAYTFIATKPLDGQEKDKRLKTIWE